MVRVKQKFVRFHMSTGCTTVIVTLIVMALIWGHVWSAAGMQENNMPMGIPRRPGVQSARDLGDDGVHAHGAVNRTCQRLEGGSKFVAGDVFLTFEAEL